MPAGKTGREARDGKSQGKRLTNRALRTIFLAMRIRDLKRRLRAARITQDALARAVGRTRPHINNVLAGRAKSRPVVEAALRLIAERQATQPAI